MIDLGFLFLKNGKIPFWMLCISYFDSIDSIFRNLEFVKEKEKVA